MISAIHHAGGGVQGIQGGSVFSGTDNLNEHDLSHQQAMRPANMLRSQAPSTTNDPILSYRESQLNIPQGHITPTAFENPPRKGVVLYDELVDSQLLLDNDSSSGAEMPYY